MSDCLFCKIVAGEIPSKVVAQSESSLAFYDIAPQAPVHVLVIPKRHLTSVNDLTSSDAEVVHDLIMLTHRVVADQGIDVSGYRLVVNVGENGLMTVPHLHVHVLGGRRMTWPPG